MVPGRWDLALLCLIILGTSLCWGAVDLFPCVLSTYPGLRTVVWSYSLATSKFVSWW